MSVKRYAPLATGILLLAFMVGSACSDSDPADDAATETAEAIPEGTREPEPTDDPVAQETRSTIWRSQFTRLRPSGFRKTNTIHFWKL